ncbi:MAG: hypothetical protein AB7R40_24005 [Nitrospiraceae bacterium]
MAEWLGRYQKEFPYMGVPLRTRAEVANMFRRGDFSRVFGVPYTSEYRVALRDKYIESVVSCGSDSRYQSVMTALKPLFDGAFFNFDQELSDTAARLDGKALWLENALADIDDVPATPEGLARLERYRLDAADHVPYLWPSEKAAFYLKLEAREKFAAENMTFPPAAVVSPVAPEVIAPPQRQETRVPLEREVVRDRKPLWQRLGEKGKWTIDKINDGLSKLAEDVFRQK